MVICLERGTDLHTAQLMPLPFTLSCFKKIQIGFTFLVLAHPGSPGQRVIKRVCVCVCVCVCLRLWLGQTGGQMDVVQTLLHTVRSVLITGLAVAVMCRRAAGNLPGAA